MRRLIIFSLVLGLTATTAVGQTEKEHKKFRLTGAARGIIFGDDLKQDVEVADTITAPKLSSGHTLVDLGLSIQPNKSMEVFGMLRVRNDFGGFWGAGTTFDVRQITVKGVVNNKVRYQIGDINYKLTPFTLYNPDQETSFGRPAALQSYMDVVNYDNFYDFNNSWRQQGAAVDFGLRFKKYVDELNFNFFTSRINRTNFSSVSERLFSGINLELVQSSYLHLAATYVNMYDWKGTSRSDILLSNPVTTVSASVFVPQGDWLFEADAEVGQSHQFYRGTDEDPDITGMFSDLKLKAKFNPFKLQAVLGVRNVEADFRSPGAQTKRINFNSFPQAYQRITNEQMVRSFTMYDLLRETDIYNLQLSPELMAFDPRYDNITPYGDATPNRSGFSLELNKTDEKEIYNVRVGFHQLSETKGQGTTELKNFQRIEAEAEIELNKLLSGFDKQIVLQAGMRMDETSRDGMEGVRSVDLSTGIMSFGIEAEIFKKFYLIGGYQVMTYKGFDFMPLKGDFEEVVYFNEFEVDGLERMTAVGMKYDFSEKDFLSVQWNNFKSQNEFGLIPNYDINQLAILYSMKF